MQIRPRAYPLTVAIAIFAVSGSGRPRRQEILRRPPCDKILDANGIEDSDSKFFERCVTDGMAKPIIDGFEVVCINQKDSRRRFSILRRRDVIAQCLYHSATMRNRLRLR